MESILNKSQSSVEISISTKGIFSGSVKVYVDDNEKLVEIAKAKADELETYLKDKNQKIPGVE